MEAATGHAAGAVIWTFVGSRQYVIERWSHQDLPGTSSAGATTRAAEYVRMSETILVYDVISTLRSIGPFGPCTPRSLPRRSPASRGLAGGSDRRLKQSS